MSSLCDVVVVSDVLAFNMCCYELKNVKNQHIFIISPSNFHCCFLKQFILLFRMHSLSIDTTVSNNLNSF